MSAFLNMLQDLPSEAKRRLLLGWLPLVVVALLLCIFGGFPPTSWWLTIRFLAFVNAVKTVPDAVSHDPDVLSRDLNALFIQAICVLIAWCAVVLAGVSEVIEFKTMYTQVRLNRLQARLATSTGALQNASPPSSPVVSLAIASPAHVPGASSHMNQPSGGASSSSMTNAVNPLLAGSSSTRVVIDDGLEAYPANPFVSKTADAKRPKSQDVQISSDQHNPSGPLAEPDPYLFDEDEQEEELSPQQEGSMEEPVFVYGNPFEGDLPDVFTYDKDLQKAVAGLRTISGNKQFSAENEKAGKDKVDQDALTKDGE